MTKVSMGKGSKAVQEKMDEMKSQKEETVVTEEKKEEATIGGARRESSSSDIAVAERPKTKRKLRDGAAGRNAEWYLDRTGDLEHVTNESVNEAIGIYGMQVFAPSEKQWAMGTVANLTLDTIVGKIKGVQVRESTRDDSGALYMQTQSRSWEKDGQKQYQNDLELSRTVEAQVLSYVNSLLVEAE